MEGNISHRTINCPQCGTEVTIGYSRKLDAEKTPERINALLEGLLNVGQCDHCKTIIRLEDDLLAYFDDNLYQLVIMLPPHEKGNQAAVAEILEPLREKVEKLASDHPRRVMYENPNIVYGYDQFQKAVHHLQRKRQGHLLNQILVPVQLNPDDTPEVVRENFDIIDRDFFMAAQMFQTSMAEGSAQVINKELMAGEAQPDEAADLIAHFTPLLKNIGIHYVLEMAQRVARNELTPELAINHLTRDEVLAVFDSDLLEILNKVVPVLAQETAAGGQAAAELLVAVAEHFEMAETYLDTWLEATARWLLIRVRQNELTLEQAQNELTAYDRSKSLPFEVLAGVGRRAVESRQDALRDLYLYLARARNEEFRFVEATLLPLDEQIAKLEGEFGQSLLAAGQVDRLIDFYQATGYRSEEHNRFRTALRLYEKGLELAKMHNNQSMTALLTRAIGLVWMRQNDYEQAERLLEEAHNLYEQLGDDHRKMEVLNDWANCLRYRGRLEDALTYYEQARAYFAKLGQEIATAICDENIAIVYKNMGHLEKALVAYYRAREIFQESHRYDQLARTEYNMANVYMDLRALQEAMYFYQSSFRQAEKDNNLPHLARCRQAMAIILRINGDYQEALTYFNEAAQIFSNLDHPSDAALAKLGVIQCQLDLKSDTTDWETILKSCERIRTHLVRRQETKAAAVAYVVEGQILEQFQRYQEALKRLTTAEQSSVQFPDLNGTVRYFTGELYERQGELSSAFQEYQAAVNILESVWRMLNLRESMVLYISDKQAHAAAIRVAYQLDKKEKAFEFLERYKSQTLLLELGTTISPTVEAEISSEQVKREQSLLQTRRQALANDELLTVIEISQQLRQLYQAWTAHNEKVALQEYFSLRSGHPLPYEGIKSILINKTEEANVGSV